MNFKEISSLMQSDMNSLDELLTTSLSSDVALINQISSYIINSGGKRLRPLIVLLLCRAMNQENKIANDNHTTMAAVIELIHTATLLHDDVVDESSTRRGNDTANESFGNAAAVLTGDFLYSRAFEMMTRPNSMEIMHILSKATNKIAEGEVLQLLNCGKSDLSEDDYFATIEKKTAVLFEAATRVAGVLSKSKKLDDLSNFGINLGNAFQIIDDILDYKSSSDVMGKEVGDDLAEGKVTLPIIYTLQSASVDDKQFLENAINNQDTSNIDKIIAIVEDNKGFEKSFATATKCAETAKKDLEFLAGSDYKTALISLCDLCLDRKS
jgi:octaprenyl-diphosphate synthase